MRGGDGTDGLTDAERVKRQRTAKAISKAKAAQRSTGGRMTEAEREFGRRQFEKDPLW